MCDIRYFKSAYHNFEVAEKLMQYYQSDELYLNDVAYNLQQCIEKMLKAFLECKGVTVPQTHSIRKLVEMSKNNGSAIVVTDWIRENQYEIETWESETRYNFDVCLEAGRIQRGLKEVRQFLEINDMVPVLSEKITDEVKEKLLKKMPKDLKIRDDFEWNCYYRILKNRL
ncbi:MAG: HEPN domain-containing protein [Clostridiales bacterium]|nr:HEPN domain-containing protein [Clostridiales bacterium]MCD8134238.1 HEPN domain-containing protein [Clostridiales bacterium]